MTWQESENLKVLGRNLGMEGLSSCHTLAPAAAPLLPLPAAGESRAFQPGLEVGPSRVLGSEKAVPNSGALMS